MNSPHTPDPLPVVRVGGGSSARLWAVAVAAILVAVAWIGLSGRQSSAPPVGRPAPVVGDATPVAQGTTAPIGNVAVDAGGAYVVTLRLDGGNDYAEVLHELQPGLLTGAFNVGLPLDTPTGELTLSWQPITELRVDPAMLGRWDVDLGGIFTPNRAVQRVLEKTVPPDPAATDSPALTQRGFSIAFAGQDDLLVASLTVEVAVWPRPLIAADVPPTWPTPRPGTQQPLETYAANLGIGADQYVGEMGVAESNRVSTTLQVDLSRPLKGAKLWINERTSYSHVETVRTWFLSLKRHLRGPDSNRRLLLDENVGGQPRLLNVPAVVRRGYHLAIYEEVRGLVGFVTVELTLGPVPGVTGDDGIFGWPTVLNLGK